MKCPYCGKNEDKVLETRTFDEENFIKRRRECLYCHSKFSTHETIEFKPLMVVKSNGSKELFDKNKIIRGMEIACRKRPVSIEQISDTVDIIFYKILQLGQNIVTSDTVGNMVCDELKNIDLVAYIRFASVYRNFESIEEFRKILDDIK